MAAKSRSTPGWIAPPLFGPEIRRLRKAARYSLRGAAEKVGVSYGYLSLLEHGKVTRAPDPVVIFSLARLFKADGQRLLEAGGLVPSEDPVFSTLRTMDVAPGVWGDSQTSPPLPPGQTPNDYAFRQILRIHGLVTERDREGAVEYFGALQRDLVLELLSWVVEGGGDQHVRQILQATCRDETAVEEPQ
jgi:hypothetical protein